MLDLLRSHAARLRVPLPRGVGEALAGATLGDRVKAVRRALTRYVAEAERVLHGGAADAPRRGRHYTSTPQLLMWLTSQHARSAAASATASLPPPSPSTSSTSSRDATASAPRDHRSPLQPPLPPPLPAQPAVVGPFTPSALPTPSASSGGAGGGDTAFEVVSADQIQCLLDHSKRLHLHVAKADADAIRGAGKSGDAGAVDVAFRGALVRFTAVLSAMRGGAAPLPVSSDCSGSGTNAQLLAWVVGLPA